MLNVKHYLNYLFQFFSLFCIVHGAVYIHTHMWSKGK